MGSDDCLQCCRWFCCVFLVLFNVLGILFGIVFVLLGSLLLWGNTVLSSLTKEMWQQISDAMKESGIELNLQDVFSGFSQMLTGAAAVFIVLGVVFIVVSCIGCCGACCGVPACLIIYAVAVALIFIAQLVVVIIWFANQEILKQSVRSSLEQQVKKFTGFKSNNVQSVTLNVIQIVFGCCGVSNGSDFKDSPNWERNFTLTDSSNRSTTIELQYPVSCCKYQNYKIVDEYCPYNGTNAVSNKAVGCYDRIFTVAETHFKLNNFFFGMIGCVGLEILLLVGALLIFCAVRNKDEEAQYREGVQYKMQPMA